MEADTKKLFNYICGSGGSVTFKRLREHPSPLAKLNATETTRKLEGIAENHKCFVLEKKDGQLLNVKMFFKIRLCIKYANKNCEAGTSCKYWHICKGYMEETCNKSNCVFSHNFKDKQNIEKIQDLGLDFLQSNAIRNIFSKCLPRFCVDYNTSNSCSLGDDCSNMHLCSKFVQTACLESNCRLQHNFKLEPNASVLRRANLSVTMPDKIIFYHILVPKKLKLKQDETNSIKQATGTNKKPQKSHEMFNCGSSELNNLNEDQAETSKGRSTSKIFVANTFGEEEPESYTQRGHQINQEKHNQHLNNSSLYKVPSDSKLLANEQSSLPPTDREICQMAPVAEQSSNAEILLLKTNKKEGINRSNLKAKSSNCKEVKQVKKSHRNVSRATSDISSFMMQVQTDGSSSAPQSLKHEAEHIHLDSKERSICMDFILDKCVKGSSCDMHHCPYPYVWQHQDPCTLSWTSFDAKDSETLEKSFCDPSVEIVTHNLYLNLPYRPEHSKVEIVDVDFEDMYMSLQEHSYTLEIELRRLSTRSQLLNPDVTVGTKWVWFWDNGSSFVEYGNGDDDKMQNEIESFFLSNAEYYPFRTNEHSYKLYFSRMYQINLNPVYSTRRMVRRRPVFREHGKVSQLIEKSRTDTRGDKQSNLPSEWVQMAPGKEFVRFKLPPNNKEYLKIEKLFRETVPENKAVIVAIERVQNPFMWGKYMRKKEQMQQRAGFSPVDERMLFHGTSPDIVDIICKENFDWRMHGKTNGAAYGQGSYFARDAKFSYRYSGKFHKRTDTSLFMFVAKVLVGSFTEGEPEMRPPTFILPVEDCSSGSRKLVILARNRF